MSLNFKVVPSSSTKKKQHENKINFKAFIWSICTNFTLKGFLVLCLSMVIASINTPVSRVVTSHQADGSFILMFAMFFSIAHVLGTDISICTSFRTIGEPF